MNLKELSKITTRYTNRLDEAFSSPILRKLVNNWRGVDSAFFQYGAKLGIEWNKVEDRHIEKLAKPKKKGIEIAVTSKNTTVPQKGRKSRYYSRHDMGLDKDTVITVLQDGKPLWWTRNYRQISTKDTLTGKSSKKAKYGTQRRISDIDAGSRSYSKDKQFGMNLLGYMSLSSILTIPGIQFLHIDLDENKSYMGAGIKRDLRHAAQFGAQKFTSNEEFKRINQSYFNDLLKQKVNDPKQLKKKVTTAQKFCQDLMNTILGGKKATGKFKSIIDKALAGKSGGPEAAQYKVVSNVADILHDLYYAYSSYLEAVAKSDADKKKYGDSSMSELHDWNNVKDYAKNVSEIYSRIMKGEFARW